MTNVLTLRILFRTLGAVLFFAVIASAYPGSSGSLGDRTQALQIRIKDDPGARSVRGVQLFFKSGASGNVDFVITVDLTTKRIAMTDERTSQRAEVSQALSFANEESKASSGFGFRDLRVTAYRAIFDSGEFQLDLIISQSSTYAGHMQLTVSAQDTAGKQLTPSLSITGGQVFFSILVAITSVSRTQLPSQCSMTPTDGPGVLPIGPYCAVINFAGLYSPVASVTVGGRAAFILSSTATSVTIAGAGVAAWDGTAQPIIITSSNGISTAPYPVTVGTAGANPVSNPNACSASAVPLCWAAASRFLEQAGFGPTYSDVVQLQSMGITAWLGQQFAQAQRGDWPTAGYPQSYPFNASQEYNAVGADFYYNSVTNPMDDQLAQKVAFVLSQLFVVSSLVTSPSTAAPYYNMLYADAFTDYPTLLGDVTLSPQMGNYLNMSGNALTNGGNCAASGTAMQPSQNYAREILQLFSIGTVLLSSDGTPLISNGSTVSPDGLIIPANQQIPAYGQAEVINFSRVFTGWNWGNGSNYWGVPMGFNASLHDPCSKTLLLGPTGAAITNTNIAAIPGGLAGVTAQNATSELNQALANIEAHPNVAPFISKFLIQHLVTSNPSPAYVQRVASQFLIKNAAGNIGDMKTVLTAILTDTEARAGDQTPDANTTFGHLQEPGLWLSAACRALNCILTPGSADGLGTASVLAYNAGTIGQPPMAAPSVFNFYSPSYPIPESAGLQTAGLLGPEFEINSASQAFQRLVIGSSVFPGNAWAFYAAVAAADATAGLPPPMVDMDLYSNLASGSDFSLLVDALDASMTHGTMPQTLKSAIVGAISNAVPSNPFIANGSSAGVPQANAALAIYLVTTSPYYQVNH